MSEPMMMVHYNTEKGTNRCRSTRIITGRPSMMVHYNFDRQGGDKAKEDDKLQVSYLSISGPYIHIHLSND